MLIAINHRTEYAYDQPPGYGVMRLRLRPRSLGPQRVLDWTIDTEGVEPQVTYRDLMGNETWLVSLGGDGSRIAVTARGRVETQNTSGIFGPHRHVTPLWLFLRPTPLTAPGAGVAELVAGLPARAGDPLALAHRMMAAVAERVAFDADNTHPATTAEEALTRGTGVCQDHTHILIATARSLDIPARYVSGYLRIDGQEDQTAMHAWAELHLEGLGWVGFDAANGISPDERYVRVASGRDYDEAAPMGGLRFGPASERLHVCLSVAEQ